MAAEALSLSHTPRRGQKYFPRDSGHTPVTYDMLVRKTGSAMTTKQYMLFLSADLFGTGKTFAMAGDSVAQKNARMLLSMFLAVHYASRCVSSVIGANSSKTTLLLATVRSGDKSAEMLGYMVILLENHGSTNAIAGSEQAVAEEYAREMSNAYGPRGGDGAHVPGPRMPPLLKPDPSEVSKRRCCKLFGDYMVSLIQISQNDGLHRLIELHSPRVPDDYGGSAGSGGGGGGAPGHKKPPQRFGANVKWEAHDSEAWDVFNTDVLFDKVKSAISWYVDDTEPMKVQNLPVMAEEDSPAVARNRESLNPVTVFSIENANRAMKRYCDQYRKPYAYRQRVIPDGVVCQSEVSFVTEWDWQICKKKVKDLGGFLQDEKCCRLLGDDVLMVSNTMAYPLAFMSCMLPHIKDVQNTMSDEFRSFAERKMNELKNPTNNIPEEEWEEIIRRGWTDRSGGGEPPPNSLDGFKKKFKPIMDKEEKKGFAAYDAAGRTAALQYQNTVNTQVYRTGPVRAYANYMSEMTNSKDANNLSGTYRFTSKLNPAKYDMHAISSIFDMSVFEVAFRAATVHRELLILMLILLIDPSRDDHKERFLAVLCGPPAVSKSYIGQTIKDIGIEDSVCMIARITKMAETAQGLRECFSLVVDEGDKLWMGASEKPGDAKAAARNGGGSEDASDGDRVAVAKQTITQREITTISVAIGDGGHRQEVFARSITHGNRMMNFNVSPTCFSAAMTSRAMVFEFYAPVVVDKDVASARAQPQNDHVNKAAKTKFSENVRRMQMMCHLWYSYQATNILKPVNTLVSDSMANLITENMKLRGDATAREPRRMPKYRYICAAFAMKRAFNIAFNVGLCGPDPSRAYKDTDPFYGREFHVVNTDIAVHSFEIPGLWNQPVYRSVLEALRRMVEPYTFNPNVADKNRLPVQIFTNSLAVAVSSGRVSGEKLKMEIKDDPNGYIWISRIFTHQDMQEGSGGGPSHDGAGYQPGVVNRNSFQQQQNAAQAYLVKVEHLATILCSSMYMPHEKPDFRSVIVAIHQLTRATVGGNSVMWINGADLYIHRDYLEYHTSEPEEGMIRMLYAREPKRRTVLRFLHAIEKDKIIYSRFREMEIGGGGGGGGGKHTTTKDIPSMKSKAKYDAKKMSDAGAEAVRYVLRGDQKEQKEYDEAMEALRYEIDAQEKEENGESHHSDGDEDDDGNNNDDDRLMKPIDINESGEVSREFQSEVKARILLSDSNSRYSKMTSENSIDQRPLLLGLPNPDYADRDAVNIMRDSGLITNADAKTYSDQKRTTTDKINDESASRNHLITTCGVPEERVDNHAAMPTQTKRCLRAHHECHVISDRFVSLRDTLLAQHAERLKPSSRGSGGGGGQNLASDPQTLKSFMFLAMKAVVALARRYCIWHLHDGLTCGVDLTYGWVHYDLKKWLDLTIRERADVDPLNLKDHNVVGPFVAGVHDYASACLRSVEELKRHEQRRRLGGNSFASTAIHPATMKLKHEAWDKIKNELVTYYSGISSGVNAHCSSNLSLADEEELRAINLNCHLVYLQHSSWPISATDAKEIKRFREREALWHPVMPEYKGFDDISDGVEKEKKNKKKKGDGKASKPKSNPPPPPPPSPPPLPPPQPPQQQQPPRSPLRPPTVAAAATSTPIRRPAAAVAPSPAAVGQKSPPVPSFDEPNFGSFNKHIQHSKKSLFDFFAPRSSGSTEHIDKKHVSPPPPPPHKPAPPPPPPKSIEKEKESATAAAAPPQPMTGLLGSFIKSKEDLKKQREDKEREKKKADEAANLALAFGAGDEDEEDPADRKSNRKKRHEKKGWVDDEADDDDDDDDDDQGGGDDDDADKHVDEEHKKFVVPESEDENDMKGMSPLSARRLQRKKSTDDQATAAALLESQRESDFSRMSRLKRPRKKMSDDEGEDGGDQNLSVLKALIEQADEDAEEHGERMERRRKEIEKKKQEKKASSSYQAMEESRETKKQKVSPPSFPVAVDDAPEQMTSPPQLPSS